MACPTHLSAPLPPTVLSERLWFNMTKTLARGIAAHQHGMHGVMAAYEQPGALAQLMEALCEEQVWGTFRRAGARLPGAAT
eukprot:365782-Chlamydomonas_euryale.AAC.9